MKKGVFVFPSFLIVTMFSDFFMAPSILDGRSPVCRSPHLRLGIPKLNLNQKNINIFLWNSNKKRHNKNSLNCIFKKYWLSFSLPVNHSPNYNNIMKLVDHLWGKLDKHLFRKNKLKKSLG